MSVRPLYKIQAVTLFLGLALAMNPISSFAQEATNFWTGGVDNNWFDGGNWSVGVPSNGEHVVIDTNYVTAYTNILLTSSTPWLASFSISNRMLTFSNWGTVLQATNVTLWNKGVLTLPPAYTNNQMSNLVYIVCSNFLLGANGSIDAAGKGYAGGAGLSGSGYNGNGPGKGYGGYYGNGAGHGGAGGWYAGLSVGAEYDATNAPLLPGSGGGGGCNVISGGAGGGVVRIEASGSVTINGVLSVNGVAPAGNSAGGGSGGSVYIECDTFGGTDGQISAAGGNGGANTTGGGGGRIAVIYSNLAETVDVRWNAERGRSINYNAGWDWRSAQKGTIYFPDIALWNKRVTDAGGVLQGMTGRVFFAAVTNWSTDTLVVTNASVYLSDFVLSVEGLIVQANGMLGMYGGVLDCMNNVILTNGGSLCAFSRPTNGVGADYGMLANIGGAVKIASNSWCYLVSHTNNGGAPLINVGSLFVDNGGGIGADGMGFVGGLGGSAAGVNGYGPGKGLGGYYGSGAAHGGAGGWYPGSGNSVEYDAAEAPLLPGSGGGGGCSSIAGGAGGGAIRIQATGSVIVNGTISANGVSMGGNGGGGGGGSVYIRCDTFGGSNGQVTAAGGNSGPGSAGGGGRIALVYTNLADSVDIRLDTGGGSATYNSGWDWRSAQKGTIYFSDSALWNKRIADAGGTLRGITGRVFFAAATNWTTNSLAISNASVYFTDFTLALSSLVIQTNASLGMYGGVFDCATDLTLTNGGAFFAFSRPTNGLGPDYGMLANVGGALRIGTNSWWYMIAHTNNGGSPLLRVGDLLIAGGGGIKADGAGFVGGPGGPAAGFNGCGPGKGLGAYYASGAGHGGSGGWYSSVVGGPAYDATNTPLLPGSGGGGGSSGVFGGGGGGTVRIEASGRLQVDGAISANGENALGNSAGGGAGGSLYIQSSVFGGAGRLSAIGGNGGANGGGGGGGRIAIWINVSQDLMAQYLAGNTNRVLRSATNLFFVGTTSATNGAGYTNSFPETNWAQVGTVWFFTGCRPQGTLIFVE